MAFRCFLAVYLQPCRCNLLVSMKDFSESISVAGALEMINKRIGRRAVIKQKEGSVPSNSYSDI